MYRLVLMLLLVSNTLAFTTSIVVRNDGTTPTTIRFRQGDVWEARNAGEFVQNVMVSEDVVVTLQPGEVRRVTITMNCIDPYRPAPDRGHQIVPTIFRFPGRPTAEEVRDRIEAIVNGNVNTVNVMR